MYCQHGPDFLSTYGLSIHGSVKAKSPKVQVLIQLLPHSCNVRQLLKSQLPTAVGNMPLTIKYVSGDASYAHMLCTGLRSDIYNKRGQ